MNTYICIEKEDIKYQGKSCFLSSVPQPLPVIWDVEMGEQEPQQGFSSLSVMCWGRMKAVSVLFSPEKKNPKSRALRPVNTKQEEKW